MLVLLPMMLLMVGVGVVSDGVVDCVVAGGAAVGVINGAGDGFVGDVLSGESDVVGASPFPGDDVVIVVGWSVVEDALDCCRTCDGTMLRPVVMSFVGAGIGSGNGV